MIRKFDNITLIGMPGAGKSTVGIVLAKILGMNFVDSDLLIQQQEGKLLWQIIEEKGPEGFELIEDQVNNEIDVHNTIISTGGSAVYCQRSMNHLKEISHVIYLKVSYETLVERLGDLNARGVSMKPDQSLWDLYEERTPLYEKYADMIIDLEQLGIRETATAIAEKMLF